MMRSKEMNKKNLDNGFSLIEMLIVVAVIAIVLGTASSYFSSNISLRRYVGKRTSNSNAQ